MDIGGIFLAVFVVTLTATTGGWFARRQADNVAAKELWAKITVHLHPGREEIDDGLEWPQQRGYHATPGGVS